MSGGPGEGGESWFLGIDAGGTNCRARLADASGAVLGQGVSGPANTGLGLEVLVDTLLAATRAAFVEAGVAFEHAAQTSAGIGIAGLSRHGARGWLEAAPWPFAQVAFASDAVIANLGAHGGEDGATLSLGTGSVALLSFGGVTRTIGGYGFPISDEGSGAALGLSAMRHALRALDGRTVKTPLSAAITERFDHDPVRAIAWMDEAAPRDYAAFAPLVMDYADANDAIARSIVENAAGHIERFIETIFEAGAPRCALLGGLAPRMRPWLRERTLRLLSEPRGDALDGALRLAGLRGE
jgi:glucosamine kinase